MVNWLSAKPVILNSVLGEADSFLEVVFAPLSEKCVLP